MLYVYFALKGNYFVMWLC